MKIDKPEDFGIWLYNEIQRRKRTQVDIAKETGITEASVCYYIKSKRFPRLNVLIRILKNMGKHIEIVDD